MANKKTKKDIPPPPGADAPPEKLVAYFEKYAMDWMNWNLLGTSVS